MTITFTSAKRERGARRFRITMNGGVATCDCAKFIRNPSQPCEHIDGIRALGGTGYLTK